MSDPAVRRLAKVGVAVVMIAAVWTDGLGQAHASSRGAGAPSHAVVARH